MELADKVTFYSRPRGIGALTLAVAELVAMRKTRQTGAQRLEVMMAAGEL